MADKVRAALDLLIQAGVLIPVTKTSCNGLPLGDEADQSISLFFGELWSI